MLNSIVLVEELQASSAVKFDHVIAQFLAAGEDSVKFLVTEADVIVVLDGAVVIHLIYIGPKAGAEAHLAWLACCVKLTAAQIVRVEVDTGITNGGNLAVTGRDDVYQDAVVATTHHYAILDDDGKDPPCLRVMPVRAPSMTIFMYVFILLSCLIILSSLFLPSMTCPRNQYSIDSLCKGSTFARISETNFLDFYLFKPLSHFIS